VISAASSPRASARGARERNKVMSDRVSASITIDGSVTADQFDQLAALICNEALCLDWDGDLFLPDTPTAARPFHLCAHDVPWGKFEGLEQFCCNERIAYHRWSGACPGSFGAERIVFDGKRGPFNYDADEDDRVVLTAEIIEQLG
jgi:hypothetical protein